MYTIKKVSELVGIPTVTIRAWENRYHIITPKRSDGGHRLYNQSDINTLKWLKDQIENHSMKISDAVRLLKHNYPLPHSDSVSMKPSTQTYEKLGNQLFQSLIHLNSHDANRLIDMAFSLHHYEDVFHKVLTPVLIRLGDEWELGTISVAQEHFSSELIMERCSRFLRVLPVNNHLPKVIAFCPEGENHHIGLLLFSVFLRKNGIDVIYLGPNTPYSGIKDFIKQKGVQVVAISLTRPQHLDLLHQWIKQCHQENPDISFVFGGKGFQDATISTPHTEYLIDELKWEAWFQSTIIKKA